jgi:hypothetical protein
MKKEIADLEKAKKPTKTLRGLLKIYEASYDRLKCVHHLGPTISPRDPDARCKADKAALEKQMKDEQSKIDQLKSSLRGARSSEDLHRIVDPLYTALSDFGILWTKYTKLPCAHLPKPIPPPPDPQCEVTKALLENRIAVIKAEIADLDKKISATRSFVEKENLKTVAKSRRILLKIQQDRYNGLLCVKHPAAPRWLPPAAAKAKV